VPGVFVEHQRYILDYQQGRGRGVMAASRDEGWHSSGRRVPVEISLSEAELREQRIFSPPSATSPAAARTASASARSTSW